MTVLEKWFFVLNFIGIFVFIKLNIILLLISKKELKKNKENN